MASSLPAASAAASVAKTFSSSPTPCSIPSVNQQRHWFHQSSDALSSRLSSNLNSKLRLSSTEGLRFNRSHSSLVNAQSNEVRSYQWFSFNDVVSRFRSFWGMSLEPSTDFNVGVDGPSNHVATPATKSKGLASEEKDVKPEEKPSPPALASETSISELMTQVSSLVKLVDSRDIMELQLKHLDCEIVIRKKEALPQPPLPAPVVMMPPASAAPPVPPAAVPPVSAPAPSSTPAAVPSPPAAKPAKPAKPSFPPLKSPMAGTLYRSPGPGQPPFVKIGDKVQKGQVLCIIEAMKLMNEIEADHSGKIVEIIAEDGKPVSVDTPLFVIEP